METQKIVFFLILIITIYFPSQTWSIINIVKYVIFLDLLFYLKFEVLYSILYYKNVGF